MYEKADGCPKCGVRGNAPITWDDDTGYGTYGCHRCGHTWETWWEIQREEPVRGTRIADMPLEYDSTCPMCGTPCNDTTCSPGCRREMNEAYGYPTDPEDF